MFFFLRKILLILFVIVSLKLTAQKTNIHDLSKGFTILTDTGTLVLFFPNSKCKEVLYYYDFIPRMTATKTFRVSNENSSSSEKSNSLIKIRGSIQYDFFYRNKIDTPFQQNNLQQHTERIYLDMVVKDKYPLRLNIVSKQSNSLYFKNYLDFNIGFNQRIYVNNMRKNIFESLQRNFIDEKLIALQKNNALLDKYKAELTQAESVFKSPAWEQRILEEKERYYNKTHGLTIINDNELTSTKISKQPNFLNSNFRYKATDIYHSKEDSLNDTSQNSKYYQTDSLNKSISKISTQYIDSLKLNIVKYKNRIDSINNLIQSEKSELKERLSNANSISKIKKIAGKYNLPTDSLQRFTSFEKKMLALKNFGIGKTSVNYTELTVQDIFISGINIEYNPSYYAAFAAGRIDYRFREIISSIRKPLENDQYLALARFGLGDKEHKAIIISYFTGSKSIGNYQINNDSIHQTIKIVGYSIEAILKKDENSFLSLEYAKTTKPVLGSYSENKKLNALLNLHDPSNEGINFKYKTCIKQTGTRLSGFYRKTGESFQSFSLFSYNTNQTAWLSRIDQSFSKNKINFSFLLRRNDFSNPFVDKTYKTTTVFKSILFNIRLRKYPILNFGYYPNTQIYFIDKDKIRESAYYIINTTLSHSYIISKTSMNSIFMYNKYTSEATDSGFNSYNGSYYYFNQSIHNTKGVLQLAYSFTKQSLLTFTTLESSYDYSLKRWLNVNMGIKYNHIKNGSDYYGVNSAIQLNIPHLGTLQLQYDKSFLPSIHQELIPIEVGRISYYRTF